MNNPQPQPAPFGFTVRQYPDDAWVVSLPHQCDDWDIAPPDATREQASDALRAFIAAANEALADIEAGRRYEAEYQPDGTVIRYPQESQQ